jgi:hypothetical protein
MRGMHDTPPSPENDEAAGAAPEQKRCGPEDMECRIGELERQQRRSDERMNRMERMMERQMKQHSDGKDSEAGADHSSHGSP